MGPFGVNVKEDKRNAHGVPANNHKEERKTIRRWDMGDSGSRRHIRGIGNPVRWDLSGATAGNNCAVGGTTSLI